MTGVVNADTVTGVYSLNPVGLDCTFFAIPEPARRINLR